MFVYRSKANLDVHIFVWQGRLCFRSNKTGYAGEGFVWKLEFHVQFWSMIYLPMAITFYCESDNFIEFETLVGKRSFIINRNIRTTTNIILRVISEKTNRS